MGDDKLQTHDDDDVGGQKFGLGAKKKKHWMTKRIKNNEKKNDNEKKRFIFFFFLVFSKPIKYLQKNKKKIDLLFFREFLLQQLFYFYQNFIVFQVIQLDKYVFSFVFCQL